MIPGPCRSAEAGVGGFHFKDLRISGFRVWGQGYQGLGFVFRISDIWVSGLRAFGFRI